MRSRVSLWIRKRRGKLLSEELAWPKRSFGFFGTSLWENPNDLFGQFSTSEVLDDVTFTLPSSASAFAPQCLHNV